jgi:hypothetical protein
VKPLSPQQKVMMTAANMAAINGHGVRVEYAQVHTARSLVRLGLGTLDDLAKKGEPRYWMFTAIGGAA